LRQARRLSLAFAAARSHVCPGTPSLNSFSSGGARAPPHLDDFEADELAAHRITFEEAVSVFEQPFGVRRNKGYGDRYQILGITDGGRRIKLIVQVKLESVVRIITGWDL
jgi:hypothetical protein